MLKSTGLSYTDIDFVTSYVGHLENISSLSYEISPDADTLDYTVKIHS